jgi:hypothetical protein
MVDKGIAVGGACCCVTVLAIISAILLGLSYKNIDYHRVGITKDTVSKDVDESRIYMPGK